MIFSCEICNYSTKRRYNLNSHYKTKKHLNNVDKKIKNKKNVCSCGKIYKSRSGLWKHSKKCNNQELNKIKKEIKSLKKKDTILINELIKNNKNNYKLIKEVKKMKGLKNQIITNNTINQNISINVFLNQHCQNAMNLNDFIEKLQITFEDLLYTGKNNYVEGISNILITNLNKLDGSKRPIHCSDVKRKIIYIKNEEGWEKDKQHQNIKKCIKNVELKQIKKIPEWTKEENINVYKNDMEGIKYQKVIFNTMGGMTKQKREKNEKKVVNKISKEFNYKKIIQNCKDD